MGHNEEVADTLRSASGVRSHGGVRVAARRILRVVLSVLIETPKAWEGEKSASKASERTQERVMAAHAR
jgi:hypothetical protein